MAIATLLRANITSVAKTPAAAITWFLESVTSRADRIQWSSTVINFLDIATSAVRKIGVKVEMDLGDGALTAIPAKDLGPVINLSDSLDGYGVQTCNFERFGDEQSPIKSSMLRRMGAVRLTGYRGTNGAIGSRPLFDGFIRQGSYSPYPPVGRIDCLDTALTFLDKPFIYSLAQGSHLSREEVLLDMCAVHSVPVGTWDLPVADGFRGGKLFKGIEEGGETNFMGFLVEWLVPIGCRPQMRDGKLNIARFGTDAERAGAPFVVAPIRTLTCGDIRSLSCEPPPTNGSNAVSMSSSIFNYTGPEGRRTLPPEIKETSGIRQTVGAINRQNKSDGTITPITVFVASGTMITSRTITTRTFDGGTLVHEGVEEWGWYSPLAARYQQAAGTGTITWNAAKDVFQYADGSWRTTQHYDFQIIRRRSLTRNFDPETGYLVDEVLYVEQFAPVETYRGSLNPASGAEVPEFCYLTENGVAWVDGQEQFQPSTGSVLSRERNQIIYEAFDGQVTGYGFHVDSDQRTVYSLAANPAAAYAGATIYYFGIGTTRRYGRLAGTGLSIASYAVRFTQVSEHSYRETVSQVIATGNLFPYSWQSIPPSGSRIIEGSIPYLDQLTAYQVAQAATWTEYDDVKIAMSRGVTVIDGRQNDYCETDGELRTAAFEALRSNNHLVVNIEMDFDMIIESGKVIALAGHPKFNYETIKLLVVQREVSLNLVTGENSQSLTCRYYPPELMVA